MPWWLDPPAWLDLPAYEYTWLGLDRSGPLPAPDPLPSFEERKDRCELMGLVFCNCTLDNGHVVVYNPDCPVHNLYSLL